MRRLSTYFCLLLLLVLSLVGCKKADNINAGTFSEAQPDDTFHIDMSFNVEDAVWYNGAVVLLHSEFSKSLYPELSMFTFESDKGGKISKVDKQVTVILNKPENIIGSGDEKISLMNEAKGNLTVWGDNLIGFITGTKDISKSDDDHSISKNIVCVYDISYNSKKPNLSSTKDLSILKVSIPGIESNDAFTLPAGTQFQGSIYLLVTECTSGRIALLRTQQTTPTTLISWEFVDWLPMYDGSVINYNEIDLQYDITTGYSMENGNLNEHLYVGIKFNKDELQISSWENGVWSHHHRTLSTSFKGDSFKLQPGVIAGVGQNKTTYIIQAICSKGNRVISYPFSSTDNSIWGSETQLRGRDGGMGTATILIPAYSNNTATIPYKYISYISVLHGDKSDVFNVDLYRSNEISVVETPQSPIGLETYLTDESLRSLCALIGIIEGPPPTLISRQEDFSAINPLAPSELTIANNPNNANSFDFNFDHSLGFATLSQNSIPENNSYSISSQTGLRNSIVQCFGKSSTQEMKIEEKIGSTYENRNYAKLLYSIPNLCLYRYYLNTPDGDNIFSEPIYSAVITKSVSYRTLNVDLEESPFKISSPSDLSLWSNRIKKDSPNETSAYFPLHYTFGAESSTATACFSTDFEYKNSVANRQHWNWTMGARSVKGLFNVQIGSSKCFAYNYSWQYKVGRGISITYNKLDKVVGTNVIYNPHNIHKYTTNTYLLFPGNSTYNNYLDALKTRKDRMYILSDEKPWVLAYEIENLITF